MNVQLNYLKVSQAVELADFLYKNGRPTENRILIVSPSDESKSKSGLIIPETVKEGMPRKGVVLTRGFIDECNQSYDSLTSTGTIVTYGLYAGKELSFDLDEFFKTHPDLKEVINKSKFTVLALNEIIYAETNLNV